MAKEQNKGGQGPSGDEKIIESIFGNRTKNPMKNKDGSPKLNKKGEQVYSSAPLTDAELVKTKPGVVLMAASAAIRLGDKDQLFAAGIGKGKGTPNGWYYGMTEYPTSPVFRNYETLFPLALKAIREDISGNKFGSATSELIKAMNSSRSRRTGGGGGPRNQAARFAGIL